VVDGGLSEDSPFASVKRQLLIVALGIRRAAIRCTRDVTSLKIAEVEACSDFLG